MRIEIIDLPAPHRGALVQQERADVAVAIDVIRAFTTAAVAFASGARSIACVEDIDAALRLRATGTADLCIGEERGRLIAGFDGDNSPRCLGGEVKDARLAQRTTNGTRGLVQLDAEVLFAAGATTASATAAAIGAAIADAPDPLVRLLCTDAVRQEDRACAEFIAASLRGERPSATSLRSAVLTAGDEHLARLRERDPERALEVELDIERCAAADQHPFAMHAAPRSDGAVLLTI